jgi:hypothetical protein
MLIGATLIGLALTMGLSIKTAPTDEERLRLFYVYGYAIATLVVLVGILLIIFPGRLLAFFRRRFF